MDIVEHPGLECVDAGVTQLYSIIHFFINICIFICIDCFYFISYNNYQNFLPRYIFYIGLLFTGWQLTYVYRMLTTNMFIKTTSNGVIFNSLIKKNYLNWNDIQDAVYKSKAFNLSFLQIKTTQRNYRLFMNGTALFSVYQHLNRINRASNILINEYGKVLLSPLPGNIPQEGTYYDDSFIKKDLNITTEGIYASMAKKQVFIPWNTITKFGWGSLLCPFYNSRDSYLIILGEKPKNRLQIKYELGNEKSEQFMLIVISYLRKYYPQNFITLPPRLASFPNIEEDVISKYLSESSRKKVYLSKYPSNVKRKLIWLKFFNETMLVSAVIVGMPWPILIPIEIPYIFVLRHLYPDVIYIVPKIVMGSYFPIMLDIILMCFLTAYAVPTFLAGRNRKEWIELAKLDRFTVSIKFINCYLFLTISLNLILLAPALMCRMQVTNNGIYTHEFFKLYGDYHPWPMVKAIYVETLPSSSESRHSTKIIFTDGKSWIYETGNDTFFAVSERQVDEINEFIGTLINKPIQVN